MCYSFVSFIFLIFSMFFLRVCTRNERGKDKKLKEDFIWVKKVLYWIAWRTSLVERNLNKCLFIQLVTKVVLKMRSCHENLFKKINFHKKSSKFSLHMIDRSCQVQFNLLKIFCTQGYSLVLRRIVLMWFSFSLPRDWLTFMLILLPALPFASCDDVSSSCEREREKIKQNVIEIFEELRHSRHLLSLS